MLTEKIDNCRRERERKAEPLFKSAKYISELPCLGVKFDVLAVN